MPGIVHLMNSALRIFAGSRIISPDDDTAEAMHCAQAWDEARDAVLAAFPWGFATRWARLARNPDAPPFGFRNSYALPPDYLYLIDVRSDDDLRAEPVEYHCVGACVYTDAERALARYVRRHENPALWPQHFCEPFTLRLASAVAPYLSQEAGMGVRIRELYLQSLVLAANAEAKQERAPRLRESCDYIDGRQGV